VYFTQPRRNPTHLKSSNLTNIGPGGSKV
jgi:hypothetical protein